MIRTLLLNSTNYKKSNLFRLFFFNGLSDDQLSYTDFISNFVEAETVADASVDSNANVGHKDIVTLLNEMPKPHRKLLALRKIYYEMNKTYGFVGENGTVKSFDISESKTELIEENAERLKENIES